MIVVTADTNVYISGLVFGGVPRQFLNAARVGQFRLAISAPIKAEIVRVLRDKFLWSSSALSDLEQQMARLTVVVEPAQTIEAVPNDPDDDRIVECAVEARAAFIVTGDNDLLRLGRYGSIQIVKVATFLEMLQNATLP